MAAFQATVVLLIAFIVVILSTPVVRRAALRWRLGDKPNGRKIHTDMIPHLGGIGIFAGVFIACGVGLALWAPASARFYSLLIPAVAMVVALGITDDIKNLKARQKLTIQILAAAALAVLGVKMFIGIPVLDDNWIFVVLLTVFYLVGISSSVNLVDGHDGLAAGLSLISASAFAFIGYDAGVPGIVVISLAVVGACAGFLFFNFPPGRIFMGDTGSMFLGVALGITACSVTNVRPDVTSFAAVTFILAVPMLDCWLAIARRLVTRTPVFQADCNHMHHLLASFGFSKRQTLGILYSMQAVLALLGVLAMRGSTLSVILGCVLIGLTFVTFIRVMVANASLARENCGRDGAPPKFAPGSMPSLEK